MSEDHRKSNEEVVEITVEPYKQALRQDLVVPSKAPAKSMKRADLDLNVIFFIYNLKKTFLNFFLIN